MTQGNEQFIPLLSGKPLAEFTPAEFRSHVTHLFKKWEPKSRAPKKVKPPFLLKKAKKGHFILKINRTPKYLTPKEIDALALEHKIPLNEMWLLVKKRDISIWSDVQAQQIIESGELPW